MNCENVLLKNLCPVCDITKSRPDRSGTLNLVQCLTLSLVQSDLLNLLVQCLTLSLVQSDLLNLLVQCLTLSLVQSDLLNLVQSKTLNLWPGLPELLI